MRTPHFRSSSASTAPPRSSSPQELRSLASDLEDAGKLAAAADMYRSEFGVPVELVRGAGHPPLVEQPAETARLLLALDRRR